ncbi:ABC transporter ATP-binding protein [Aerobium aerolatum]|uniref:Iron(III) transport system ATP-binding protein n=1 Tax=Aquamicrobium aerolatum DSM 21857 TaxID=1121003 RepID=A0A1I3IHB9_9HYPH|nr:ABC transporter ATP-binding protein [Aquamicrobium aerolatum]SFI47183.1 iron(III) transport system ATP-binding protein [Aquamicrobium aerolatum DSM 21857]
MVDIIIQGASRRFGQVQALSDINLHFPSGSFTSLLGPSGCGKTTMLRLIAGFETPDSGSVAFDGVTIADPHTQLPPEKRGIGVVFQSYALWPHMNVAANVGYPLAARGVAAAERERRVREVLATVGLEGYDARRTDELSGGQRQRVALARCLVADSRVILFDEPLANLDMHLRASMVEVFRDIHRRSGATMIYVTHDQAEALALSDRIAVMDQGRVLQLASPTQVYRAPAHEKVAGFVGRGVIVYADIVGQTEAGATLELGGSRFEARCAPGTPPGRAQVLLRPEGLRLGSEGIRARVISSIYRGPVFEVVLAVTGSEYRLVLDCVEPPVTGAEVRVEVTDAWVIPG